MAKKETNEEMQLAQEGKLKALQAAMAKIEKDFGKGSIMKLGDQNIENVEVIPTGSIGSRSYTAKWSSLVSAEDIVQAALDAITTEYPVAVVDVSLVVTHADGSTDTLHELGGDVTVTVPYEQLPGKGFGTGDLFFDCFSLRNESF